MFYLTTFGLDIGVCIVYVVIFIKKNIKKTCWGLVFINCQRVPPSISLISYKTSSSYAICAVWCVMRVMWCARLFFFGKILNLWVKGRTKIPHLGRSNTPKLTTGGSHMYTLSCKASYGKVIRFYFYMRPNIQVYYKYYISPVMEQGPGRDSVCGTGHCETPGICWKLVYFIVV